MFRLTRYGVAAAVLVAVLTPTPASAVTYDKLAYLTFTKPVQVPGAVLNAGTYQFRLTNPDTSRNVLHVMSNDGAIVYAMFNTIPDSRTALTPDPWVTFRETPAGVPPPVHALFYGHEYKGYAFVYPRGGPIMIAEVVPQPEITYAVTPLPAAEPEPEVAAEPAAEPEPEVAAEPVAEPVAEQAELPRTASPLPFVAFGGLVTLLAGLGVGFLRRRVN